MTLIPEEQPESPALVWDDLLLTLKNSRFLILGVLIVTVLTAYGSLQFITWQYESKASLLVKLGRENVEVPATVEKGGVYTTGVRKEEINSEIQLLTSRPLIESMVDAIGYENFMFAPKKPETFLQTIKYYLKLAKRWAKNQLEDLLITLGLQKAFTDREKVIMAIEKYLSVAREKDSDVITLALRLPDPTLATQALDSLLDIYLDRRISVRRDTNIRTFFEARAQENKERLDEIERGQEKLKQQWDVSAIEEQRKLLLQRQHTLYQKLDKNKNERALAATQLDVMDFDNSAESEMVDLSELVVPDASAELIKERITGLRMERVKLSGIYEASSKPIQKVNAEIGILMVMLVQGLDAEISSLDEQVGAIDARLQKLNEVEDALRNLERERLLLEESYFSYSKRREDALVSEEFDIKRISNISVLSHPVQPIKPVSPRKTLIMALSLPLGLLAGVGLALLREYLNDRIRTQRDLNAIPGLTCLGTFDSAIEQGARTQ